MQVKHFTVNPFEENTYVCHQNGEAVVIDPGCSTLQERKQVLAYIEQEKLVVKHLLLTHAHIDHVIDCAYFSEMFEMGFQMHEADLFLLKMAEERGMLYGVSVAPIPPPQKLLEEGDTITFGDATWQVLHCPGHSPGSICFYDATNHFVIGGDVLFYGSIGRTDLWQGSLEQLLHAIHTKLMPLPDETIVYSGHGPQTTIGRERTHNPFLTGQAF